MTAPRLAVVLATAALIAALLLPIAGRLPALVVGVGGIALVYRWRRLHRTDALARMQVLESANVPENRVPPMVECANGL